MRAARGLEGRARADAVGKAHARTIDVPLEMIRAAAEVSDLAAVLAERGNPSLRPDAVVAAILAAAAAESGLTLITVNMGDMAGDGRLEEARKLAAQSRRRADSLRAS
jgi:methenyltetrahydrofolate cyclohydrolase